MVVNASTCIGNNAVEEQEDVTSDEISREITDTDKFLGDAFHIDKLGVVRPGRMIPKNGCPANKVQMYNDLAAKGLSWDAISTALGNDQNGKSWLRMTNAEDFTLRASDCERPEHADFIKMLYTEKGTHELKRIPISFPFDDINMMITAHMSRYNKTGMQSSGRYIGDQLVCETIDPSQPANRTTFGPKKKLQTPCNPDKCQFFQKKECKMRGGIIFRIPKVPGLGVWALYTASYYSLVRVRSMMKTIQMMADGYCGLSQMPNMFYLTKIQEKVGTGENRKMQWILTIESDFDVDAIRDEILACSSRRLMSRMSNAEPGKVLNNQKISRLGTGESVVEETGEIVNDVIAAAEKIAQGVTPEQTADNKASSKNQANGAQKASAPEHDNGSNAPAQEDSPFKSVLVPFLTSALSNPALIKGATKESLWAGVLAKSASLFGKRPDVLDKNAIAKLKDAIVADVGKKEVTAYLPVQAPQVASNPTPAPAAPAQEAVCREPGDDTDEWPADKKPEPAKALEQPKHVSQPAGESKPQTSGSEAHVNGKQFDGISAPLNAYLEAVSKNVVFDGVQDIRSSFEAMSKKQFAGKSLAQLTGKEVQDFRTSVQSMVKNGEIPQATSAGKEGVSKSAAIY